MSIRTALIAIGLAFGIWEAADTFDTGAPALVFSVLFLVSVVWLLRRGSRVPAVVIGLLCTVEATQAHTWNGAGATAKDAAMALGSAGMLAAGAFLVRARRPQEAGK